jgi:hypothetical protein
LFFYYAFWLLNPKTMICICALNRTALALPILFFRRKIPMKRENRFRKFVGIVTILVFLLALSPALVHSQTESGAAGAGAAGAGSGTGATGAAATTAGAAGAGTAAGTATIAGVTTGTIVAGTVGAAIITGAIVSSTSGTTTTTHHH